MTVEKLIESSKKGYEESRLLYMYYKTIKPTDFFKRYWRNRNLQSILEKEYENLKLQEELSHA